MKSVALVSVVIFFSFLPKNSEQTFWRRPTPKPLPSDPTAKIYQELQKIPAPQITAKKILNNFIGSSPGAVGKRSYIEEDTVFILDRSGSVGQCEFDKGKDALTKAMETCEEKKRNGFSFCCRHAGITFASSATVNFNFLPTDKAIKEMNAIAYTGGSTNTQAALEEANKLIRAGGRRFAESKVFLVTDGQSNVQPRLTIPNALKLKNMRVEVFVVAVGSYISGIDEMAKVASYPPEKHVFRVEKNSDLEYVFELALQKLAPNKYTAKKKPSPC